MRKDELRRLRVLNATPEMMEKGKRYQEVEEEYYWTRQKIKKIVPEYDLLARAQNLNGIIKVAVFLPEKMRKDIKTPRYEIFLNVKGEEYITRELDDNGNETRWLTAMIRNLKDICWYYSRRLDRTFLSKDAKDTLNRLKVADAYKNTTGLSRLDYWQMHQRDQKIAEKEAKEQAPWDADMKLVPDLPKGFIDWARKEACREFFVFYRYGEKEGYCSKCRKYVPIKEPKHNKETRCPLCGTLAKYKVSSRIKNLRTTEYYADIIRKISGGIVVERVWMKEFYQGRTYENPYVRCNEISRTLIFENGIQRMYLWGDYKGKKHRWIPTSETYREKAPLYTRNLKKLKEYSILKESAIDLWPRLTVSVERYLMTEKGNPAIEKLARIGMFRLAGDLIKCNYDKDLLNQNATELTKILKIDKQRLKRLKEMDAGVAGLRWMQCERLANTIWPDEMIEKFDQDGIEIKEFEFLKPQISFAKCYNYLKKQAAMSRENLKQTLTTWQDYINMADNLKMNTQTEQIQRPKDLKAAHDEVIVLKNKDGAEKQAKNLEKKWPKVNEQVKKLQKFEFAADGYRIVAPKSVIDIVLEGIVLRHCVHTCDYYFDRIQRDETYLFFLRKGSSPDMPWYTLEVEPSGNIRQKRTTGDNQNKDFEEAIPFLKKWQKYFKEILTEEEKELGKKADELRKVNYAELRKNQNKIWHGRLAGKLLADVLEKDFMEA